MKTYNIQRPEAKTNFLTTDFMDVWNELENTPDAHAVSITVKEMTVAEFNEELKLIATQVENGNKKEG